MGMAYYDGGDKRMAARCFDRALEKNPLFYAASEAVSMNLGTLYSEVRDFDKALPCFEAAYKLNPKNAAAKRKLAALRQTVD